MNSIEEPITLEELKQRIQEEGVILGGGILKIDSIINHQIDPGLMKRVGEHIAGLFDGIEIDRVLTAEVSGIGPGLMTALALDVPLIYARKRRPITMTEPVYVSSAPSATKGGDVLLMVSPDYLKAGDRILIIDDFLASGKTIYALIKVTQQAGAVPVGVGTIVEKSFQKGRDTLIEFSLPIRSAVIINKMTENEIIFEE